jgi:hypothetical protein
MERGYYIGADVHSSFSEVAIVNAAGRLTQRQRCPTTIPALAELLRAAPRPRRLVIEEGPLADWLWRSLRPHVDDMVVCNPRRNRLIAQEGDKDDPLDAQKLAQLYRGGYVKPVHHGTSLRRAVLKQHVGLYHDRVRHRVSEGLRIGALLRRHGVFVREKDFADPAARPALLARLPASRVLAADLRVLWKGYDLAAAQEDWMRRLLVRPSKKEEAVRRFVALPGIAWVRAATLYVWLDTPWRFATKAALWKYLGVGLERRHSGAAAARLRVPCGVNRVLKGTILGAAKSAAALGDNPFADLYRRALERGLTPRLARRTVARSLAATLWGLWKNGSAYHPEWVGVAAAAGEAAGASP